VGLVLSSAGARSRRTAFKHTLIYYHLSKVSLRISSLSMSKSADLVTSKMPSPSPSKPAAQPNPHSPSPNSQAAASQEGGFVAPSQQQAFVPSTYPEEDLGLSAAPKTVISLAEGEPKKRVSHLLMVRLSGLTNSTAPSAKGWQSYTGQYGYVRYL
jgi:hypothetical protein